MEINLKLPSVELSPIIDKLIEDTLRKLDSSKDPNFKSSALTLLVGIWISNPSKINQ
jgi:hypothetical protein